MTNTLRTLVVATLTVASASAPVAAQQQRKPQRTQKHAPPAQPSEPSSDEECPDFIRGTKLQLAETERGAAITITTTRDENIPLLRVALKEAATFIEQRSGQPLDPNDPDARIPPISISMQPVKAGMLLSIRAKNTADVPLLHQQVRLLEVLWRQSECINGGDLYAPNQQST